MGRQVGLVATRMEWRRARLAAMVLLLAWLLSGPVADAAAQTVAPEPGAEAGVLELDLGSTIRLALSRSRSAIGVRLGREEEQLSLEAAEERYDPMTGSLSVGTNAASREDETADVSIGPSLRVPTGGSFRLS